MLFLDCVQFMPVYISFIYLVNEIHNLAIERGNYKCSISVLSGNVRRADI